MYFLISIIDSSVQEHLASVHEEELELERKKHELEGKNKKVNGTDDAQVVSDVKPAVTKRNRSPSRGQQQAQRSPSPTRKSSRLSPTKKTN